MVDPDLKHPLACLMKKGLLAIYLCKCSLLKYLNIVSSFKHVMYKTVKGPPVRFYLVFFSYVLKMIDFKCLKTKRTSLWKSQIEINRSFINGFKKQNSEEIHDFLNLYIAVINNYMYPL